MVFFYLDSAHYIVIFISGPHFLKRLMIYDKYGSGTPTSLNKAHY